MRTRDMMTDLGRCIECRILTHLAFGGIIEMIQKKICRLGSTIMWRMYEEVLTGGMYCTPEC